MRLELISDYDFGTKDQRLRVLPRKRRPQNDVDRLRLDLELQQAHERNATVPTKVLPPAGKNRKRR